MTKKSKNIFSSCGILSVLRIRSIGSEIENSSEGSRIVSIDGLRGIAALGVAWFHLYTQNGGPAAAVTSPHWFNIITVWGRFGVELFFAISGFVIAYNLLPRSDIINAKSVCAYLLRRNIRLDPAYFTVLVLCLLAIQTFPSLKATFSAENLSPFMIVRNILYFLPLPGDLIMPVAWTLAFEVQFYLFFAVSVALLNIHGKIYLWVFLWGVFVAGLISSFFIAGRASYGFLSMFYAFAPGILLAAVALNLQGAKELCLSLTAVQALFFLVNRNSYLLAALISGATLASSVFILPFRNLFSSRILVLCGNISYCMYLAHVVVGGSIIEFSQTFISDEPGFQQFGFVLIGMITAIVFSSFLHKTVELPSIMLSRWFI